MTNPPTETIVLDDEALVAEMRTVSKNLVSDWYRESQHRDELVDEIAITLTAAHRRAEARTETSMRSACVEKVNKKASSYQADADNKSLFPNYRKQMAFAASTLREAASALESVSIQERGDTAAVPPNHALIQLLEAALLHPKSAEGNIRQVIETLES